MEGETHGMHTWPPNQPVSLHDVHIINCAFDCRGEFQARESGTAIQKRRVKEDI